MPLRFHGLLTATLLVVSAGANAQEPVDRGMVERIKAEGGQRSEVAELFNHFTNVIGGRLTASLAHRQAVEYARGRLDGWGLDNVHLEAWEFGRGPDLEPWLRDAEINRDRSLRLQYLAGLALDRQDAYNIYDAIVWYRRYPRELFQVSPGDEALLRRGY